MISQISFRRMLYAGTGLITAAVAILTILVIPPSAIPKTAMTPVWVMVMVHLLIIVSLLWIIKVNERGGRINKELLVTAGVILIALSLIILDGAFAYLGKPARQGVSAWMFMCAGGDFVAGLLALIGRYFRERRSRY